MSLRLQVRCRGCGRVVMPDQAERWIEVRGADGAQFGRPALLCDADCLHKWAAALVQASGGSRRPLREDRHATSAY